MRNTLQKRWTGGWIVGSLVVSTAALAQARVPLPEVAPHLSEEAKTLLPLRLVDRPLHLPAGGVQITIPVNANMNAGRADAINVNPSFYVGASDMVTLGLRPLVGLCVSGTEAAEGSCDQLYNDLGVDAIFGLLESDHFDVAAGLSLNAAPLAGPTAVAGEARLIMRFSNAEWALALAPTINHGFNDRETGEKIVASAFPLATWSFGTAERLAGNGDYLALPASFQFQAFPWLTLVAGVSFQGPLKSAEGNFGDAFRVPMGFATVFALSRNLDLAGAITFPNLRGGGMSRAGETVSFIASFRP